MRSICCIASLIAASDLAAQSREEYKQSPHGTGVFRGREVSFRVWNGQALVEGDMLLGPVEEIITAKAQNRDAVAISLERFRWPNAVVVYQVAPDLPNKDRVTQAITAWESNTPIRFKVREEEIDYVRIQRAPSGCTSNVGRIGDRQVVNLGDGCTVSNTIHELGHTIGLYHTQSRGDRNRNLRIMFENIDKLYWDQYEQVLTVSEDIGPYDYASIMHYGVRGFARNTRNSIETTPPGIEIGTAPSLSSGDILAVRKMYGVNPPEVTIATHPPGLKVTVDGVEHTAPKSFPWKPGEQHTIAAGERHPGVNANQHYRFAKWSDGGAMEHTLTVGESDYLFIANYAQYARVRTGVTPESAGTVEIAPPSADGFYPFGSVLKLRATATGDLKFFDWIAGPGGASYLTANGQGSGSPVSELSVRTDDAFYVATFTARPITTVTSEPPGIPVTVDGLTAATPRNFVWEEGTAHSLSIAETQPINNNTARAAFREWSNGQPRSHDMIAPGSGTITAVVKRQFEVIPRIDGLFLRGSPAPTLAQLRLDPQPLFGFNDEGTEIEARAEGTNAVPFANFFGDLSSGQSPQRFIIRDQTLAGANFLSPALFNQRGLVSSVTQLPSPVTPGAVLTLYSPGIGSDQDIELKPGGDGHYPAISEGLELLVGETPAELFRISKNSVTFIAPWDLGRRSAASVTLRRPANSFANAVAISGSAPGILTVDARGYGQAAAVNSDGSPNSPANPAFRGSELRLQVVGIGRFSEQSGNLNPPAGDLSPLQTLEVQLGDVPATVVGVSSSNQLGQYSVRVRIPDSAMEGEAVAVTVVSGGARSQFGVNVSIR